MVNINIGVIGANLTAYAHIESLEILKDSKVFGNKAKIEIKAICSLNSKQELSNITENFKIQRTYEDYRDLIEDPEINTIILTSPPKLHKEIYLYAARYKKHIFCEKQVALSLQDINEMIEARDENGIVSQIGFVLRAYPIFWLLKTIISNEQNQKNFGKLQNIRIRDDLQRPLVEISNSKDEGSDFSTGILFEHSINDIDIIRYLFGEIKDVFAKIKYFNDSSSTEDSVAVTFELANQSTAQLTSVWHNMRRDERDIEIFYENALINVIFTWQEGKIDVIEKDGLTKTFLSEEIDQIFRESIGFDDLYPLKSGGYGYEMLLFLKRIVDKDVANKSNLTASLEDGLVANIIIGACYESSKKNKTILLD